MSSKPPTKALILVGSSEGQHTSAAKIITEKLFTKKMFGAINFVIITKESLYKANSLACFLVKRDPPVAATLQRKSSGGIIFVIIARLLQNRLFQGIIL